MSDHKHTQDAAANDHPVTGKLTAQRSKLRERRTWCGPFVVLPPEPQGRDWRVAGDDGERVLLSTPYRGVAEYVAELLEQAPALLEIAEGAGQ